MITRLLERWRGEEKGNYCSGGGKAHNLQFAFALAMIGNWPLAPPSRVLIGARIFEVPPAAGATDRGLTAI